MNNSDIYEIGLVISMIIFFTTIIYVCTDTKPIKFNNIKQM